MLFGATAFSQVPYADVGEIVTFVEVTGVSATFAMGTTTDAGGANVAVTGVQSSFAVGSVTIESRYFPTGVSSTVALGTVSVSGGANVSVTGVASTFAVGSVVIESKYPVTGFPNWSGSNICCRYT